MGNKWRSYSRLYFRGVPTDKIIYTSSVSPQDIGMTLVAVNKEVELKERQFPM
jgi:hypothetical protein